MKTEQWSFGKETSEKLIKVTFIGIEKHYNNSIILKFLFANQRYGINILVPEDPSEILSTDIKPFLEDILMRDLGERVLCEEGMLELRRLLQSKVYEDYFLQARNPITPLQIERAFHSSEVKDIHEVIDGLHADQ